MWFFAAVSVRLLEAFQVAAYWLLDQLPVLRPCLDGLCSTCASNRALWLRHGCDAAVRMLKWLALCCLCLSMPLFCSAVSWVTSPCAVCAGWRSYLCCNDVAQIRSV